MSEQMDDLDLEVNSLERSTATPAEGAQDNDGASLLLGDTGAAPPDHTVRRISATMRLPHQQRLLRAASIIVLLALLLSAVLFIPTGNRAAVLHLLQPPTPFPSATPIAGSDAFLWEHSVPWGQLFVDGKPGSNVSGSAIQGDAQGRAEGVAFHLPRGRHTLVYRADPFPTLTCTVSVPASSQDTCPLPPYTDFAFLAPNAPLTRLLDLQATIDRLPATSVAALLATTQAYLTSLADALPAGALTVGDHYLDRTGQVTQAQSALRITPQFRLDASVEQHDGVRCVTLCTATNIVESYNAGAGVWSLLAPVALTWRYTTPAGQEVISNGPGFPVGAVPYNVIPLRVGWSDGAWQTPTATSGASQTDPVICPTGAHVLSVVQLPTAGFHYQWPIAASTADLGCLYAGSERDVATGAPSSPMALVLYHAGALIAANAHAHEIFPKLPVASAHEAALAQAVAPTSLT
jgi:hypothetical protein